MLVHTSVYPAQAALYLTLSLLNVKAAVLHQHHISMEYNVWLAIFLNIGTMMLKAVNLAHQAKTMISTKKLV